MVIHSLPRSRLLGLLSLLAVSTTVLHSFTVAVPVEGTVSAVFTACADGIDNDHDGLIDYPQDIQCLSLHDDSEGPTGRGLFLTVSDGVDMAAPAGSLSYTIALRTEREIRKEVDVYFQMPHQTNLVSASDGGRQDGELIIWRNVSVYPGVVRKIYVNVGISPYAQQELLLVAQVTSEGEKDTDTTRVESNEVQQLPSLKIAITDGKQYAQPYEELTYIIAVRNPTDETRTFDLRGQIPARTNLRSFAGAERSGRKAIQWSDQTIGPRQSREYTYSVRIEDNAEEFMIVRARASINQVSDVDTTSIHTGVLPTDLSITVNDGLTTTVVGSLVTYNIVIDNTTNRLATEVEINNALPQYMEFISATEGGRWIGKNVRWTGLTVSPFGQRVLQVTGRVRSDAPIGNQMKNTVLSEGYEAVDLTDIGDTVVGSQYDEGPIREVLISKVADRSEVQPGDTVRYTVALLNVTNHPLTNILVEDRMDSDYVRILNADQGQNFGNKIIWTIPSLQPGEEWVVHYTMKVDAGAPNGITIPNIVTVSGEGMETLSLTERISTSELSVIRNLPPTGAAFDAIFLGLTTLLGAVQTMFSRRKYLLV